MTESREDVLREFRTPVHDGWLAERLADEIIRVRTERDAARAALKDICEEWSEANGAVCDPKCDAQGHEPDCTATSIAAYLRSLRTQLAEAQRNSKRLDWLELLGASLHCNFMAGPEAFTVTDHNVFTGNDTAYHGATVRAAIDAAMAATPEGTSE